MLIFSLGIKFLPHPEGCLLSQGKYITGLLQRAKMDGARPISTPIIEDSFTAPSSSPEMTDSQIYRCIVGALQYVTIIRPDIAFAVNRAYQFMHAPTEYHWEGIKRIFRYLKGTVLHGLGRIF